MIQRARVKNDSKLQPAEALRASLRADIAKLVVEPEDGDHAIGFNAAIREVLAIFDHHERDRKKRSAHALAQRTKEGKKTGGDVPYGFVLADDGETLLEALAEQRVISAARKLRSEGHSLREVARLLATRKMFPREGAVFHAAQIKRMTDEET